MSKRVTAVLSEEIGEALEEMAKEEQRSHSQMGAILIGEAIRARQLKKQTQEETPKERKTDYQTAGKKGAKK